MDFGISPTRKVLFDHSHQCPLTGYGMTFLTKKIIAQPTVIRFEINLLVATRAISLAGEVENLFLIGTRPLQSFSMNICFESLPLHKITSICRKLHRITVVVEFFFNNASIPFEESSSFPRKPSSGGFRFPFPLFSITKSTFCFGSKG